MASSQSLQLLCCCDGSSGESELDVGLQTSRQSRCWRALQAARTRPCFQDSQKSKRPRTGERLCVSAAAISADRGNVFPSPVAISCPAKEAWQQIQVISQPSASLPAASRANASLPPPFIISNICFLSALLPGSVCATTPQYASALHVAAPSGRTRCQHLEQRASSKLQVDHNK